MAGGLKRQKSIHKMKKYKCTVFVNSCCAGISYMRPAVLNVLFLVVKFISWQIKWRCSYQSRENIHVGSYIDYREKTLVIFGSSYLFAQFFHIKRQKRLHTGEKVQMFCFFLHVPLAVLVSHICNYYILEKCCLISDTCSNIC